MPAAGREVPSWAQEVAAGVNGQLSRKTLKAASGYTFGFTVGHVAYPPPVIGSGPEVARRAFLYARVSSKGVHADHQRALR